jgi:hypothetical protein
VLHARRYFRNRHTLLAAADCDEAAPDWLPTTLDTTTGRLNLMCDKWCKEWKQDIWR